MTDETTQGPLADYFVTMRHCRAIWHVQARSAEHAEQRAWDRYEAGYDPDEVDCDGASVDVRHRPALMLSELLSKPPDDEVKP